MGDRPVAIEGDARYPRHRHHRGGGESQASETEPVLIPAARPRIRSRVVMEDRRRRGQARPGASKSDFFSRGGFYCLDARRALVSESTVFRSTDTCADPFVVPRARHSYAAADPERDARARRERRDVRASRARADPNTSRGSRRPARRAIRVARGSSSRNDATTVVLLSEPMSPTTAQDRRLADLEAAELHAARARAERARIAPPTLPPRGRRTVVPDDADDAPRFPAPGHGRRALGRALPSPRVRHEPFARAQGRPRPADDG